MIQSAALWLAESGVASDAMIRAGIRRACERRLSAERERFASDPDKAMANFLDSLSQAPIAEATERANEQHYELPPQFFELVLGPRRKYSGCDWEPGDDLATAETRSLEIVVERALLQNGQRILELGCGWGSLSLYLAERFPDAQVVGVSNSSAQRTHILAAAAERGLRNLEIVTADINGFNSQATFDRIVTVEMLEHVRNYRALFARMAEWLEEEGRLFVHVFRHRSFPYLFEVEGAGNWMGRHFFTGGVMPSHSLLTIAQDAMAVEADWQVSGTHYMRTANAWLANLDAREDRILDIFVRHYGSREAHRWLQRWRLFFMACAELFGYANGTEWGVSHYRFRPAD